MNDKPVEVVTDLAQALETVIEEQIPRAFHNTGQYANNRAECDHGRLSPGCDRCEASKRTGQRRLCHAFTQNLRRDHYELGTDAANQHSRIAAAFDVLVGLI